MELKRIQPICFQTCCVFFALPLLLLKQRVFPPTPLPPRGIFFLFRSSQSNDDAARRTADCLVTVTSAAACALRFVHSHGVLIFTFTNITFTRAFHTPVAKAHHDMKEDKGPLIISSHHFRPDNSQSGHVCRVEHDRQVLIPGS